MRLLFLEINLNLNLVLCDCKVREGRTKWSWKSCALYMLWMKEEVDNQDVQHLKEVFICTTLNIERATHSNKQYNICAQTYHTYSK